MLAVPRGENGNREEQQSNSFALSALSGLSAEGAVSLLGWSMPGHAEQVELNMTHGSVRSTDECQKIAPQEALAADTLCVQPVEPLPERCNVRARCPLAGVGCRGVLTFAPCAVRPRRPGVRRRGPAAAGGAAEPLVPAVLPGAPRCRPENQLHLRLGVREGEPAASHGQTAALHGGGDGGHERGDGHRQQHPDVAGHDDGSHVHAPDDGNALLHASLQVSAADRRQFLEEGRGRGGERESPQRVTALRPCRARGLGRVPGEGRAWALGAALGAALGGAPVVGRLGTLLNVRVRRAGLPSQGLGTSATAAPASQRLKLDGAVTW